MVVTAAPPLLRTVIALPKKSIISFYVPGATTTSSTPDVAALIPA
jgi:hypothetical protein